MPRMEAIEVIQPTGLNAHGQVVEFLSHKMVVGTNMGMTEYGHAVPSTGAIDAEGDFIPARADVSFEVVSYCLN